MTDRPLIAVPHRVEYGNDIRLYAGIHLPFLKLMASLYPTMSTYVGATVGYSAFSEDGRFIGTMAPLKTMGSIRKNPLLTDDSQLFLRALLGGMSINRVTTYRANCVNDNYGTLRLFQKLGLGIRVDGRTTYSALASPDSLKALQLSLARSHTSYTDARAYAARALSRLSPEAIRGLIPLETDMVSPPVCGISVTLC